jgi:hydrogenase maturation protease
MGARVLVLGYGNPAREDDALGPLVAEGIAGMGLAGVAVESDYQLNVEDAVAVAQNDAVVFVDAATEGPEPFSFRPVEPGDGGGEFSSHALRAESVMGLARQLFGSHAAAYMLGVRGYSFRMFQEELTAAAARNAEEAVRFLAQALRDGLGAAAAE